MQLSKRQQAQIERRLVVTLTEACETAKAEIVGFSWLTHELDYALFASSLRVIWVFDTQQHLDQALAAGQAARMIELTASALQEADVEVSPVAGHVQFVCELQAPRVAADMPSPRQARSRARRG